MKFFIDTEFLEGSQKKSSLLRDSNSILASVILVMLYYSYKDNMYSTTELVIASLLTILFYGWHFSKVFKEDNKPGPNTIDLISIAIVREDGYDLYEVSKDFNLKEAWDRWQRKTVYGDMRNKYPDGIKEYWIRINVLKPIFNDFLKLEEVYAKRQKRIIGISYTPDTKFTYKNFKRLRNKYGKTNKEIADSIEEFTEYVIPSKIVSAEGMEIGDVMYYAKDAPEVQKFRDEHPGYTETITDPEIKFYAWYADYDWVAFCWLFGKMIELPSNYPQYCNDLKQSLVEKWEFRSDYKKPSLHPDYPENKNAHNALDDAKWNKEVYEFIQNT